MALLLVWALQNPAELIRSLGSDSAETRAEAARRLKTLGTEALPALRAAAEDPDPEIRGQVADLLAHLARVQRVGSCWPSPRKIRLRLNDIPFTQAVERTLGAFGLTPPVEPKSPLSLELKDASFWEAVEALEAASGLRYEPEGNTWSRKEGLRCRAGDVLFRGSSRASYNSRPSLLLKAWLPPGAWAATVDVEDVEALIDGRRVQEVQSRHEGSCRRRSGRASELSLPWIVFDPKDLKGAKEIEIRGTLRLGFPTDVEILRGPLSGRMEVAGGTLNLDKLVRGKGGRWDFELSADGGDGGVLLSVEDAKGRWLADLYSGVLSRNSSFASAGSAELPPGESPSRVALLRSLGESVVNVPFVLKGIKPN